MDGHLGREDQPGSPDRGLQLLSDRLSDRKACQGAWL